MIALPDWRQVDAFTGPGCAGNPAAVMRLDAWPGTDRLAEIARIIGLPATAFLAPSATPGRRRVRWFSASGGEIALCGHGSLAAGHVLLGASDAAQVELATAGGQLLVIRRLPGESRYELSLPAMPTAPLALPAIAAAIGGRPVEMRWNPAGYALLAYRDASEIAALAPDFAALAACGCVQVSVTAPGGGEEDVTSRVFTTSGGGGEDAATGSAHAVLAPHWSARLGRADFTARQASVRGGWFEVSLAGDAVRLGGACRDAGQSAGQSAG
ncbi:MAG: PhzF family phenazine biosynthesis protein [Sphingomonadales bacterium]|nr:PhzF family phenazine biosynthesis protein [Sphingomonadales bacterium]MBD3774042.1 PhzF family phenazine biosynthesis protein [Paracoccaceae bacterium]